MLQAVGELTPVACSKLIEAIRRTVRHGRRLDVFPGPPPSYGCTPSVCPTPRSTRDCPDGAFAAPTPVPTHPTPRQHSSVITRSPSVLCYPMSDPVHRPVCPSFVTPHPAGCRYAIGLYSLRLAAALRNRLVHLRPSRLRYASALSQRPHHRPRSRPYAACLGRTISVPLGPPCSSAGRGLAFFARFLARRAAERRPAVDIHQRALRRSLRLPPSGRAQPVPGGLRSFEPGRQPGGALPPPARRLGPGGGPGVRADRRGRDR